MQQRRGFVSRDAKIFIPFDETDGNEANDSITGFKYNPLITTMDQEALDFFGPPNLDGFLQHNIPYAARIQNDDSKLPTFVDIENIIFDVEKVILISAIVINRESSPGDGNQTRIAFGVAGYGNVISNSMQLAMHISFTAGSLPDGTDAETVSLRSVDQPGGGMSAPPDTLGIVYLVWDGPNDTLFGKFLNMDGTVYNDGSQDFSLTITQPLTNGQKLISFRNMSRLTNADYYSAVAAQYNAVPDNLDAKLAQWGVESVKGNKGFPDL